MNLNLTRRMILLIYLYTLHKHVDLNGVNGICTQNIMMEYYTGERDVGLFL